MKALILSAGLGTRLRPITQKIPKPGVEFLTLPLALYAVEYGKRLGIDEFIFNTHYLAEQLKNTLIPYLEKAGVSFQFIHEDKILGSGGGLKNIEHLLDGSDVAVINGDEIVLPKNDICLAEFRNSFEHSNSIASLLCMKHPEAGTKFGGVWTNSDHSILGFGKKELAGSSEVFHFTGLSLYRNKFLKFLPKAQESNILYDGVCSAINDGLNAAAFVQDIKWFETGNPQGFYSAQKSIVENWSAPENSIIKSTIELFGGKQIKKSLEPNFIAGTFGFPIESAHKNWLINSKEKFAQSKQTDLDQHIILSTFDENSPLSLGKILF